MPFPLTVSLVTISGLLLLLPVAGTAVWALVELVGALVLYRLVLHGLTIVAVHHLSGGTAAPRAATPQARKKMRLRADPSDLSAVSDPVTWSWRPFS
ncbi:MAG TPA: hypothetical protein VGF67_25590 [Ktedonobacteraceae bacterium]